MPLFDQTTRRVRPTRAGAALCDAALRSAEEMKRGLAAARAVECGSSIRMSVPSSIAMKWLVPRLADAGRAGLDLSLDAREELVALDRVGVEAALRFGKGPYPDLHATRLAFCRLQPVAGAAHSVAHSAGLDVLDENGPELLADARAEQDGTGVAWADYAGLMRRANPLPRPTRRFDRSDLMLQAAVGSLGVAFGRTLLIEDDIRNGMLVPVGTTVRASSSYWLVTSTELAESEKMQALRSWLRTQVAWSLRSG